MSEKGTGKGRLMLGRRQREVKVGEEWGEKEEREQRAGEKKEA